MRVPWNFENPACAEIGMEPFYPEVDEGDRVHTKQAISICNRCPHLAECAEWGLYRERFGIWGGTTASKRTRIREAIGIKLPRESCA